MKEIKMLTITENRMGINIYFDEYEIENNTITLFKDNKMVGVINHRKEDINLELVQIETNTNLMIHSYILNSNNKMGGD